MKNKSIINFLLNIKINYLFNLLESFKLFTNPIFNITTLNGQGVQALKLRKITLLPRLVAKTIGLLHSFTLIFNNLSNLHIVKTRTTTWENHSNSSDLSTRDPGNPGKPAPQLILQKVPFFEITSLKASNIPHILIIPAALAFAPSLYSQNTISGALTGGDGSVTKVSFTNTSNGSKYAQRTTSGSYNISEIPNGTYLMKVEDITFNYFEDEVTINSNTAIDNFLFKDAALTSSIYLNAGKNLLFLLKDLTATFDETPGQIINRLHNGTVSVFYDRTNIPTTSLNTDLNTVVSQFTSNGMTFNEQSGSAGAFIRCSWVNSGPDALTEWATDHWNIYFNKNSMQSLGYPRSIYAREFGRATGFAAAGADPDYALYFNASTTNTGLHHDEQLVIQRYVAIPNGTDMFNYKSNVVTTISNVMPDATTLNGPSGNVAFNDITVTYTPVSTRDGDGERQKVYIKLTHSGIDQIFEDADCDGSLLVTKANLLPNTIYTISASTKSGLESALDVTSATNSKSINVGSNVTLPSITLGSVYAQGDTFIIPYNPHPATDTGGNTVSYLFTWTASGLTPVSVTDLAHTGAYPTPKTSVKGHTPYTITGKAVNSTSELAATNSVTFTTPNNLPTNYTYTLNIVGDYLVWNYNLSSDLDVDPLSYGLNLNTTLGFSKDYNDPTPDGTMSIPLSELPPHVVINSTSKVYDGFNYTISTSTPSITKPNRTISPYTFNATIVGDNVVCTYPTPTDPDADAMSALFKFVATNYSREFPDPTYDGTFSIPLSELPAHAIASITSRFYDGYDYVSSTSTPSITKPNILPTAFQFTNPTNGVTISYVNHQLRIDWTPLQKLDSEGDTNTDKIKLAWDTSSKTYSLAGDVGFVLADSADLPIDKQVTLSGERNDGYGTISSINTLVFTTPKKTNTPPIQITLASINKVGDNYILNYNPHPASDTDGDPVNYKFTIPGVGTFIDTNHTGAFPISASNFKGHTPYSVSGISTDGKIDVSSVNSLNWTTPNGTVSPYTFNAAVVGDYVVITFLLPIS